MRSKTIIKRMKPRETAKQARKIAEPFRITNGKDFRLKDIDPGETLWLKAEDKLKAKDALALGVEALSHYQEMLYAEDKRAVLLIFQAMDAAGKDGAIKHVLSGVNPQGCQVHSFKAPTSEDLDHDYLWRSMKVLPTREGPRSPQAIWVWRHASASRVGRGSSFIETGRPIAWLRNRPPGVSRSNICWA